MGNNPSATTWQTNLPVESISWNDCQSFIQKLNTLGQGTFRLPAEAEWEYACRAGTITSYYWGNNEDFIQSIEYAWWFYDRNDWSLTHEVGLKKPNLFELFDMSGNVWEWCQDWYGSYSSNSQTDPAGPLSGSERVLRGGSWSNDVLLCRSAHRYYNPPDSRNNTCGIRLLRSCEDCKNPLPTIPPTPIPTTQPSITWLTNLSQSIEKAKQEKKYVLLVAGRETCANTNYMRKTVMVMMNPPILSCINEHYVCCFSDVDASTDYYAYTTGLGGFTLPLICVVDPNKPKTFIDRSTNIQTPADLYDRLVRIIFPESTPLPTKTPTPTPAPEPITTNKPLMQIGYGSLENIAFSPDGKLILKHLTK